MSHQRREKGILLTKMCHAVIAIKNKCVPIKLVVNLIILSDKHYMPMKIQKENTKIKKNL